ncbi:response regulator transcription factor [Paenibacillus pini]|uniref:Response regulator receiver n=1 Tax=Paenibacillus pini JCM 16418 TaxID=1236976 RepID=W7YV33_9BACL|nr:response regulator transcription factor [Paenibacillus pini]GAF08466.1 response regulator receiver [Paenibacillus pini JCM 16418]
MRLLIIEDDQHLSDTICETTGSLFQTEQAFDGEEGLFLAEQNIYDVIILDIMLPQLNGYEVLDRLRSKGITTPVLMLTAKDSIDDKIQGFKKGADDYLVKPFHREELLLRLEAILRRSSVGDYKEHSLQFKDLKLNLQNLTVTIGDEPILLNGKQIDLLEYLIHNRDIILTKEQIFDRVWGMDSSTTNTVIEVYISNLRKKFKQSGYDKYIKTIRGTGYMLSSSNCGEEHE